MPADKDQERHSFSVEDAKKYGLQKAILLSNFRYWISENRKHNRNLYDGHYWTFWSAQDIANKFPYFTRRSISRWLNELEESGVIKSTSKYNRKKYDKTKWYRLNDESVQCIGQNGQPIPHSNPYINNIMHSKIFQAFSKVNPFDTIECTTEIDLALLERFETMPEHELILIVEKFFNCNDTVSKDFDVFVSKLLQ